MKRIGSSWMRMVNSGYVLTLSLMALTSGGCGGAVLDAINQAPVATILTPTNGQTLYPGQITFQGTVDDLEDRDLSRVRAKWVVTGQGSEWTCDSVPSSEGAITCTMELAAGNFVAELTATDTDGTSASARAQFTLYNGSPTAELNALESDTVESNDLVLFEGMVSDPEDSPERLTVTWGSSLDGTLGYSTPRSDGTVSIQISDLSPGDHVISLTAEDSLGAQATDELTLTVLDCPDADEDGINTCADSVGPADCDDKDPAAYPGASEQCDGKDNDCDDQVDEGFDQDTDGYVSCTVNGVAADCNDQLSYVYPGATEQCNDIDDNCDGAVDEEVDADSDGQTPCGGDCDDGQPTVFTGAIELCDLLDNDCDSQTDEGFDQDNDGVTSCGGDCNDQNSAINPAAVEVCNRLDDNCNDTTDEGFDTDGDGYSTCANDCDDESADVHPNALESCNGADDDCDRSIDEGFDLDGDGYTSCNGDCDDSKAYVSPAGTELCDSYDNNCDGQVDENYDMDQDGYSTCQGDCNDAAPDVNPGIEELCNGRDDNCNEQIDEAFDQDNDGVTTCDGDCNDTDATIRPGAGETCNSKDDDCDGQIDEDFDQDVDSYTFCEGDCNDSNASIHPDAVEVCDSVDNNCNNQTDEGVKTTYYADVDRDTYGSTSNSTQACSKPSGYVATGTDCNDADATVYPGAPEGTQDADSNGTVDGDGLDNDCDGVVDEGTDLYDDDIDGYTEEEGDCDDSDAGVNPGEAEGTDLDGDGLPDPDGVDNNCNLEVDEGTVAYDDDGDGFSELEGDCDDGDVEVYPGGIEVFDGLDNDCDGQPETEILLADAFSFRGAQSGAMAGFSVAGPGDLDGDGLADLIIGSPRYNLGKGAVHVVLGHESWGRNLALSTNSVTLNEEAVGAQAGYSVSAAGDLNDDGYPDFAVGAPYYDSAYYIDAGTAYVVFGRAAGWESSAFTSFANGSITGLYSQVYVGISLAGGGNVNGDSFDDLLVGAPWPGGTGSGSGWIMIVPGKSTNWTFNMQASTLSKIAGNQAEATGYSMALTGHTDSDGYDDIVAGGQYDPDQTGDAWFIPGAAKFTAGTSYGPPDVSGKRYYGTTKSEFVGDSVAAAGDVNGDGYDDFLVGRRGDGNGTDAKAYLYLGPNLPGTGTAQSTASVRFTGSSTDKCPCVVSGLGDIDADGYADFAIGATKNTDDAGAGKVYLFYGGPSGTFATSTPLADADMQMYGETSNDQAGAALSGAGDLNGDGFDDFVIGAPTNDQAGTDSGKVYVLFGFPRQ